MSSSSLLTILLLTILVLVSHAYPHYRRADSMIQLRGERAAAVAAGVDHVDIEDADHAEVNVEHEIEIGGETSASAAGAGITLPPDVIAKKVTCPFAGSAVASGALPVQGTVGAPIAQIADIVRIGNTGGGTLGYLLKFFSTGNHGKQPAVENGPLVKAVPTGTLSLDFPGSQGAHPGHSGILMGDWRKVNTGAFNNVKFQQFISAATSTGTINNIDIGNFIAANLIADPQSKVVITNTNNIISELFSDSFSAFKNVGVLLGNYLAKGPTVATADDERAVVQALAKVAGDDNLIGSAGEFGLLCAFLKNSPRTQVINGRTAFSVAEITGMFRDKKFPIGWDTWKKQAHDWVSCTVDITFAATKQYSKLRRAAKKL